MGTPPEVAPGKPRSDRWFYAGLAPLAAGYVLLILLLLIANVVFLAREELFSFLRFSIVLLGGLLLAKALRRNGLIPIVLIAATAFGLRYEAINWDPFWFSIGLTLVSCTVSALLSVLVAIPTAYLLTRRSIPGKRLIDAILDIPIVLPPLVIGLSLLILFNQIPTPTHSIEKGVAWLFGWLAHLDPSLRPGVTYKIPAVILAQFTVAAAFAVRTMVNTFEQSSPRNEQVALTLGCSRAQAFWQVVVPESWRGVLTAGTLAWTRSLGEFGPILVFAGTIRNRTEVMSSTVFLEISIGNLEGAVTVSLLMVLTALVFLLGIRSLRPTKGVI